jgi:hypothetical protein
MTTKQILSQFRNQLESIPPLQDCSDRDKTAALRGLLEFLPALEAAILAEPPGGWVVINRHDEVVFGPTTEFAGRAYLDKNRAESMEPIWLINSRARPQPIYPPDRTKPTFPQDLAEMPFTIVKPNE